MIRIDQMDNTELPISLFDKANKKHKGCSQAVSFNGQRSCKLFHHILDNSTDVAVFCGSCLANTKGLTTHKMGVRN